MQNYETNPFPSSELTPLVGAQNHGAHELRRVPENVAEDAVITGVAAIALKGMGVSPENGLPRDGLLGAFDRIPESNKDMAERSVEALPFKPTPEVIQSVEGFYNDNDKMLLAVSAYVRGDATEMIVGRKEIDNPLFSRALEDLTSRMDGNRTAEADELAVDILRELYSECSVGAMTMSDEFIAARAQEIFEVESALRPNEHINSVATNTNLLTGYRQGALQETRPAGMLLFHNTPHLGTIIPRGFKISGRSGQTALYGSSQSNTIRYKKGHESHTNVLHFSEAYDPWGYHMLQTDNRNDIEKETPLLSGTVAIPLAEVIKVAPYARDTRYAVLEAKPDSEIVATSPDETTVVGIIAAGQPDVAGRKFLGTDRVFFASNELDSIHDAHNYSLDFGPMGREVWDTSEPKGYIIRTGVDAGLDGRDLNAVSGAGFGYPNVITVQTPKHGANEVGKVVAPELLKIEADSNSRYPGQYVVPLRGHQMEFLDEGAWAHRGTGLARRYVSRNNAASATGTSIQYA
ncbi:MAG: hypothetical protein WBO35_02690 [Candidatus Saccharimonadales bacterium]